MKVYMYKTGTKVYKFIQKYCVV